MVRIEWRDIVGFGDWNEKPETFDLPELQTLFYLVDIDRDDEKIIVASTLEEAMDDTADHSGLPLGAVKRITYLKEDYSEKVVGSYSIERITVGGPGLSSK